MYIIADFFFNKYFGIFLPVQTSKCMPRPVGVIRNLQSPSLQILCISG